MSDVQPPRPSGSLRSLWLTVVAAILLSACASPVTRPEGPGRAVAVNTAAGAADGAAEDATEGTAATDRVQQTLAPVAPLNSEQQQLLALAETSSEHQDWARAAEILGTLLDQRPDYARAKARLAWVRQQQGDLQDAEALYRQALAQDPTDALTVNNLALLIQAEGNYRQAQELLLKGLQYSPEVPELHFNLAVVSELYLLDLQTALAHYRRYQQLAEGENPRVAGWIADLERRIR